MNFSDLESIIDTDKDNELLLVSGCWEISKHSNSQSKPWMTEDQFNRNFSCATEFRNNANVFIFESFERIYKDSGLGKRLDEQLELSWATFDAFQMSTDILCFYMVPKSLDWVLYANRDYWQFAKSN